MNSPCLARRSPLRWCDEDASLEQSRHGLSTSWVLKGLGSTTHFMTDRAVKVRAGNHPRFRVDVLVPRDVCTRSSNGKCLDFDNRYATATYVVGTSGR